MKNVYACLKLLGQQTGVKQGADSKNTLAGT
jgi:hypothetical protein